MLVRFLAAVVGGVAITATMLIGMSEFAAMFRERGGDRFFLIDVLPRPDRGRPNRPGAAALPPQREVDLPDATGPKVGVDGIGGPDDSLAVEPEPALPDLDLPESGSNGADR